MVDKKQKKQNMAAPRQDAVRSMKYADHLASVLVATQWGVLEQSNDQRRNTPPLGQLS